MGASASAFPNLEGPAIAGTVANKVFPNLGPDINNWWNTTLQHNEIGGSVGSTWDKLTAPFRSNPGNPTQAPPPPPNYYQAQNTALSQELSDEQRMRSSWSILTGSEGVLESPNTASRTLLT